MAQPNKDNHAFVGTVVWFSDVKGYGFIETSELKKDDGSNRSIFCHYSHIQSGENYRTLSPKTIVTFEVTESLKGLMAVNVREHKVKKVSVTVVNQ